MAIAIARLQTVFEIFDEGDGLMVRHILANMTILLCMFDGSSESFHASCVIKSDHWSRLVPRRYFFSCDYYP